MERNDEVEQVIDSDTSKQKRELIRLRCKRKKELWVTRSLLTKSSSYFAAMLSEGSVWEESSNKVIELSAWNRSDLVAIVHCLKNKTPDLILKNVNRYFEAINYFSIHPLAERCIEYKIANVSNESVLDDLRFAERYSISTLKEFCMHRLLNNLPEILAHPESNRNMTKKLLKNLLRHEQLSIRCEDEVLSIVDLWCSSTIRETSDRVELLHLVRFAHLTEEVFEKCRKDVQCLEVPDFRALLENPRWSDLDENILAGRSFRQVHMHTVGLLRSAVRSVREALLYCSASGTKIPADCIFSETYIETMLHRCRSARFGDRILCCSKGSDQADSPVGLAIPHEALHCFSDPRERCPSLISKFPNVIFSSAPPLVLDGDFCIAHLVCKSELDWSAGYHDRDFERFDELEFLRYRSGGPESKRLRVRDLVSPWERVCRALVHPESNTLRVENEWAMLVVSEPGLIFAIDRQPAIGPVIEIPSEFWEVGNERRGKMECFSDMAIVGNVAYVLLKYGLSKICSIRNNRKRAAFYGRETVGSILAYNLVEGKLLSGQSLNLNSIFVEDGRCGGEKYRACLKVVHNEVFLIGISKLVEARGLDFPVARNFVYRIDRAPGKLVLTSVGPDTVEACTEDIREKTEYADYSWEGTLLNVDAHPCEYASMLQRKAHRERDPIEREKLRRFIW